MAQAEQARTEIRRLAARVLDARAIARLNNVRLVNPNLATQVELYIAQMHEAGRITPPLSDEHLKELLDRVVKKTEWTIKRK